MYNPEINNTNKFSEKKLNTTSTPLEKLKKLQNSAKKGIETFLNLQLSGKKEYDSTKVQEETMEELAKYDKITYSSTEDGYDNNLMNLNSIDIKYAVDDIFYYAQSTRNKDIFDNFQRLISLSKLPNSESLFSTLKSQICTLIAQNKLNSAMNDKTLINFLVMLKKINEEIERKSQK